jgi:hypothetical protein
MRPGVLSHPSIARRIFRAFARFLFAVLVGIGGTLVVLQVHASNLKIAIVRGPSPTSTTLGKGEAPVALGAPEYLQWNHQRVFYRSKSY